MINLKTPYIAFDGIDGSGKTSAVRTFYHLIQEKYPEYSESTILLTKEVGGTRFSENLRNLLLTDEGKWQSYMTQTLLVESARASQREYVLQAIEDDCFLVISDRCEASTYAYQASLCKDSKLLFYKIEPHHPIAPTLYVHMKVYPEIAMKRVEERGIQDSFEVRSLDYFNRVAKGYDEYFDELDSRGVQVVTIDANGSKDDVNEQLIALVASVNLD